MEQEIKCCIYINKKYYFMVVNIDIVHYKYNKRCFTLSFNRQASIEKHAQLETSFILLFSALNSSKFSYYLRSVEFIETINHSFLKMRAVVGVPFIWLLVISCMMIGERVDGKLQLIFILHYISNTTNTVPPTTAF